jgi:hypothetical protein
VAVNCSVYPEATAIEDGLTAIDDNVACPTVMVVELETELELAEIVALPRPELVARP